MFKKFSVLALIVMTMLFVISCGADHQVRIKNNTGATIYNFQIGSVDIGTISNGATTDYYSIDKGTHTVDGNYTSGGYNYDLYGSIIILGNGDHNWTVTVGYGGSATISED